MVANTVVAVVVVVVVGEGCVNQTQRFLDCELLVLMRQATKVLTDGGHGRECSHHGVVTTTIVGWGRRYTRHRGKNIKARSAVGNDHVGSVCHDVCSRSSKRREGLRVMHQGCMIVCVTAVVVVVVVVAVVVVVVVVVAAAVVAVVILGVSAMTVTAVE